MDVWKMILPFRDVFQVVRFRGSSPNEFTTFLSAQFGFLSEEKTGQWQMAFAMFLGLTWV